MDRREFLKRVGAAGLCVAGSVLGAAWLYDPRGGADYFRNEEAKKTALLKSYRVERGPGAVTMSVVRGKDPEKMVRAGLDAMGGISSFVQKGDVVLIKPNVAFDRAPALGATTSPEVLRAVVLTCREAGARRVIVADNPINQPEGCFFKSGIQQAATDAGADVMLPKPNAFSLVKINGEVLKTWSAFYQPLDEATKVIGIAPCKDHNLCSASMTMKNWYGLLGGRRNQFHQQIHAVIADFARMIQPTFVVLDATRVLMQNGPTGGKLSDVQEADMLVIGTDMVAVDTFGYTLFGRDPQKLEYVYRAEARGLGSTKWKEQNWREVLAG